jgi:hypothetical protein
LAISVVRLFDKLTDSTSLGGKMKHINNRWRSLVSIIAAVTVVNLFALGSFANSSGGAASGLIPLNAAQAQDQANPAGQTAVLTGHGQINVNGNPAKSGATVLSGNAVTTGSGSYAAIEMGPAGRLELRADTAATPTFSPGSIQVNFDRCGVMTETVPAGVTCLVRDTSSDNAKVIVKVGQVTVRYSGGEKTLNAGDSKHFDGLTEVSSTGASQFTIECGHHIAAAYWFAGGGLLALAGVVTGIEVSGSNNNNNGQPVASGATP